MVIFVYKVYFIVVKASRFSLLASRFWLSATSHLLLFSKRFVNGLNKEINLFTEFIKSFMKINKQIFIF